MHGLLGLHGFRWIWCCISTTRYSVMVNRVSSGFSSSYRGLTQGLSLYLFGIGMEVLSIMLHKALEGGYISTLVQRSWGGWVEHFVSSLCRWYCCFCKAPEDQMLFLSWVLFWLEVSSGMKTNLDKYFDPSGWSGEYGGSSRGVGCQSGLLKGRKEIPKNMVS